MCMDRVYMCCTSTKLTYSLKRILTLFSLLLFLRVKRWKEKVYSQVDWISTHRVHSPWRSLLTFPSPTELIFTLLIIMMLQATWLSWLCVLSFAFSHSFVSHQTKPLSLLLPFSVVHSKPIMHYWIMHWKNAANVLLIDNVNI